MTLLGKPAPDFTLPDQDGRPFSLREARGRRLLLVFYPGDETPVCTAQLCDYRDGIEAFADLGVELIGISPDDAESHRRFREARALPFRLLSDPDGEVARRYGAWGLFGMKRAVFLVDRDGIVRYEHVEAIALFRRSREELLEVCRRLDAEQAR
ncbi:MAG: peroxiredoxin [Lysobacterales bacterium]|jgi:peroxiredoxin Q/BCP|nr:MAG: peroxiredoxin [Xanthomonadales bacterium]